MTIIKTQRMLTPGKGVGFVDKSTKKTRTPQQSKLDQGVASSRAGGYGFSTLVTSARYGDPAQGPNRVISQQFTPPRR
jgi:hypothetical protein